MDCPLFWEAVNNQSQTKHKLALAAVQKTKNIQAENDLPNKDVTSGELSTKSLNAVTEERNAVGLQKTHWKHSTRKRAEAETR